MNLVGKISKHSIVIFKDRGNTELYNFERENGKHIVENNRTNGVLSEKSARRLKNTINTFLYTCDMASTVSRSIKELKFVKPTFVTLTLCAPQFHTDLEVKRLLLNTFIVYVQREVGVINYIWRAEKQKNNNIHFHLLFDKHIDWKLIRSLWNQILKNTGYLEKYTKEMSSLSLHKYIAKFSKGGQVSEDILEARYKAGVACLWSDPNSTDIHAISKVDSVNAYICKYMAKAGNGKELKIEGRLWGCSDSIKVLKSCIEEVTAEELNILKEKAKFGDIISMDAEFYTVYYCKSGKILEDLRNLKDKYERCYYYNCIELFQTSIQIQMADI